MKILETVLWGIVVLLIPFSYIASYFLLSSKRKKEIEDLVDEDEEAPRRRFSLSVGSPQVEPLIYFRDFSTIVTVEDLRHGLSLVHAPNENIKALLGALDNMQEIFNFDPYKLYLTLLEVGTSKVVPNHQPCFFSEINKETFGALFSTEWESFLANIRIQTTTDSNLILVFEIIFKDGSTILWKIN